MNTNPIIPRKWFLEASNGYQAEIFATSYEEADKILFFRLMHNECPLDTFLVGELTEDDLLVDLSEIKTGAIDELYADIMGPVRHLTWDL